MDRGDREAGSDKSRQRHVDDFVETSLVQHRSHRGDVGDLAVDDLETGGRIHPRVRRHHENAGSNSADGYHQS